MDIGAARATRGRPGRAAGQPRPGGAVDRRRRSSHARPAKVLEGFGRGAGHVFNLGHGVSQLTPPETRGGPGGRRARALAGLSRVNRAVRRSARHTAMKVARVALDVPLPTLFDYSMPAAVDDPGELLGRRVVVPFGRGRQVGVVLEVDVEPAVAAARIKPLGTVFRDESPLPTGRARAAALRCRLLPLPDRPGGAGCAAPAPAPVDWRGRERRRRVLAHARGTAIRPGDASCARGSQAPAAHGAARAGSGRGRLAARGFVRLSGAHCSSSSVWG